MKTKLLLLLLVISSAVEKSQAQIITTIAGNGTGGYSGDGGQATAAELSYCSWVGVDALNNIYIGDYGNQRIRKVNTFGIISTIAGGGIGGDGGQATAALITGTDFCFDAIGNMYIADIENSFIRKVNTSGIISTVAGDGTLGCAGDGGQATLAGFNQPSVVQLDTYGNIYIGDNSYNIRKINTNGIITTIAGICDSGGYSGDGGQATAALLAGPWGITFDHIGNMYIADSPNNVIRKINTLGIITTIAGTGVGGFSGDGGQATNATLHIPGEVIFDNTGNMYFADWYNNRVRKVNTAGIITTVVGSGSFGPGTGGFSGDGGQATAAELNQPTILAFDSYGNLYISDASNSRIRKVTNVAAAGIEQFASNNEQVSIYPNPATNSLQVSFSGNSEGSTLVITDMLGNTVKQTTCNTQHTSLNIADVSAGVYFITITSGTTNITQKVIVR